MTRKVFLIVTGAVIAAKFFAMLAGSYPFDFATYVYQARGFFEYGINPLFYWNKGMPLLGIFYSQYALYQASLNAFTHSQENVLLAHLMFKFIFFAADLLTAYYIMKIVVHITDKKSLGHYAALIWLLNPFLLWSVEVQGSYAILAVLFSTVSFYLILKRRFMASVILLALSASIYYYAAVFLPFYIIKYAYETKSDVRKLVKRGLQLFAVFAGSTALLYLPYFLSSSFTHELISSLLYHSQPNASPFDQAVQLPTYSLIKFPYYLITHQFPTNVSNPGLFRLVALMTPFGILAVTVVVIKTAVSYIRSANDPLWRRMRPYSNELFLYDILTAVTIFMLLVGGFQDHYLIWVFPYIVVAAAAYGKRPVLRIMILTSFMAVLRALATNNLGFYFLDVVPFGTINEFFGQAPVALALTGFVIMILLAANIVAVRWRRTVSSITDFESRAWFFACFFFSAIIAAYSIGALVVTVSQHKYTILGSDKNVYDFAYVPKTVTSSHYHQSVVNIPIKDSNFSNEKQGFLAPNHFLNPGKSPWYLYNYEGTAKNIALIAGTPQGNALVISPMSKQQVAVQLNLGAKSTRKSIPVRYDRLYKLSVTAKSSNLSSKYYTISARYIDQQGNVIPGSDVVLEQDGGLASNGWSSYSATLIPPFDASYLEPLITVATTRNSDIPSDASMSVSQFSLQTISTYLTLDYNNVRASNNGDLINDYMLTQRSSRYFEFNVEVPRDNYTENVPEVKFNSCINSSPYFDGDAFNFNAPFPPRCYKKQGLNEVSIVTVNYMDQPQAQLSLTHKPNSSSSVTYHQLIYKLLVAVGAAMTLSLLAAVIIKLKEV